MAGHNEGADVGNTMSGSVQTVMQFRDHHGDVRHQHFYPVPTVRDVPHQVGPAMSGFVNRVGPLGLMAQLSIDRQDVPRIIVLVGARGAGKTETVRRFAHQNRDRFPGGQLHIDFGEWWHRGIASIDDAQRASLRGLGVHDLPTATSELVKLYRTRVSSEPVLVVLDDAWLAEQVRAFVPTAPGSVVLVTCVRSLSSLALDGAEFVEIKEFPEQDGVDLLVLRCGEQRIHAERSAAARLVELCAGLPIALQAAAARLATEQEKTVAALVAELSDAPRRLKSLAIGGDPVISSAIDTVFRILPRPAAQLCRRLGVLPGKEFTADVAAMAAGISPDQARRELTTLVEHWLMVTDGHAASAGRYRFRHDLIRLYAVDLAGDLPEGEVSAALRRVVEHLLELVRHADRLVMGERTRYSQTQLEKTQLPFSDRLTALTWLQAERGNLMAAFRAADDRGWSELVWPLAMGLSALFVNHRYLSDWRESGLKGADAAAADGRPEAQARLLALTSRPMLELGLVDETRNALDAAQQIAEKFNDGVLLGSVWEFRGRYLEQVDPKAAATAYQRSIDYNRAGGEPRGVALATFFYGRRLDADGRSVEALPILVEAHEMFLGLPKGPDQRMAARVKAALGASSAHLGRYQQASGYLEDALRTFDQDRLLSYQAEALELLADVRLELADPQGARDCLQRAIEILRYFGSPRVQYLLERRNAIQGTEEPLA